MLKPNIEHPILTLPEELNLKILDNLDFHSIIDFLHAILKSKSHLDMMQPIVNHLWKKFPFETFIYAFSADYYEKKHASKHILKSWQPTEQEIQDIITTRDAKLKELTPEWSYADDRFKLLLAYFNFQLWAEFNKPELLTENGGNIQINIETLKQTATAALKRFNYPDTKLPQFYLAILRTVNIKYFIASTSNNITELNRSLGIPLYARIILILVESQKGQINEVVINKMLATNFLMHDKHTPYPFDRHQVDRISEKIESALERHYKLDKLGFEALNVNTVKKLIKEVLLILYASCFDKMKKDKDITFANLTILVLDQMKEVGMLDSSKYSVMVKDAKKFIKTHQKETKITKIKKLKF